MFINCQYLTFVVQFHIKRYRGDNYNNYYDGIPRQVMQEHIYSLVNNVVYGQKFTLGSKYDPDTQEKGQA